MKPLFYSEMEARNNHKGWMRCGEKICWYKNQYVVQQADKIKSYYTLTFTMKFPHGNDICYLAPCFPFPASLQKSLLDDIEKRPKSEDFMKRSYLCKTISGNLVDLLTITNFTSPHEELKLRPYIFFSARIHPGESQSSWLMKGLVDFITSNDSDAVLLRDRFIFKIVPMLNMEGVIQGNHRCSLSGVDLNRQWINPDKNLHPEVFHLKQLIAMAVNESSVALYVDLHGHFRKKNIFMYGCGNEQNPELKWKERIFPHLLSQRNDHLNLDDCSWKVTKPKCSTGRVVVGRELGVLNSFTLEATFGGIDVGIDKNLHLSIQMCEQMGVHLVQTILDLLPGQELKWKETFELVKLKCEIEEENAEQKPKRKLKKKKKKVLVVEKK